MLITVAAVLPFHPVLRTAVEAITVGGEIVSMVHARDRRAAAPAGGHVGRSATRFSEPSKLTDAIQKVKDLQVEVEQAWATYDEHRAEHAARG